MIDDLGLNLGEVTIVVFVVFVVLSARFWPGLGERVAVRLWGGRQGGETPESPRE